MGRVMKKRYLRIVAMALVAVMSVLCIPGTFSKYSKEDTYTVAVKQKEIKDEPGKIVFNTNKTDKDNAGYTSPEGGYYAVLVKGGNGGSGVAGSGSWDSGWKTDSNSVGKGGIMLAIIHLTENQSLSVTVGKTGDKIICEARQIKGHKIINKTGRHKTQRIILKDNSKNNTKNYRNKVRNKSTLCMMFNEGLFRYEKDN